MLEKCSASIIAQLETLLDIEYTLRALKSRLTLKTLEKSSKFFKPLKSWTLLTMKILFAVQGTGNGHLSRASEILPVLSKYGEVDVLISGTESQIALTYPVKYHFKGLSFAFGSRGNIDYLRTVGRWAPVRFLKDIRSFSLDQYDAIINDFEPITAWAAQREKRSIVSISHQCSFLSPFTPRSKKDDPLSRAILRYYAPCVKLIGLHFQPYDSFITTPIIKSEIRALKPSTGNHITVYLPGYNSRYLTSIFSELREVQWEIFSRDTNPSVYDNVAICRISHEEFNRSLSSSIGLMTGGGFESPAEAFFLGKKLIVVPMKGHYEQRCNAEAAAELGALNIPAVELRFIPMIRQWLRSPMTQRIDYPDNREAIVMDALGKGIHDSCDEAQI